MKPVGAESGVWSIATPPGSPVNVIVNASALPTPEGHVALPFPKPGTFHTVSPRHIPQPEVELVTAQGKLPGLMVPLEPEPENGMTVANAVAAANIMRQIESAETRWSKHFLQ